VGIIPVRGREVREEGVEFYVLRTCSRQPEKGKTSFGLVERFRERGRKLETLAQSLKRRKGRWRSSDSIGGPKKNNRNFQAVSGLRGRRKRGGDCLGSGKMFNHPVQDEVQKTCLEILLDENIPASPIQDPSGLVNQQKGLGVREG